MNKVELRETLESLRSDLDSLKFHEPQSRDRVQRLSARSKTPTTLMATPQCATRSQV
ncbi:hypothetical protein [Stenotrophobium rhamnosiphilum]|uniref:hypothetical protein n=1 Tax=Stenotrophobium rhamnosiphilum TaxID=2029166 RepID=UPI001F1075CE|nr:hypothetical protein [Stenotrophobium rhamnosiphilum]